MAFGFDITDVALPPPQENVLAAASTTRGTIKRKRPARPTNGTIETSTPTTAASTRTSACTSPTNFYQTLPLYSNLGTTGVYVYARSSTFKGHSAKITAESQVRNDRRDAPKTFDYEVVIDDADG